MPARLDRLPWTRFHWLVVTGLGVSWILDGLEIQIVALVGTVLVDKGTLHLTAGDIGFLASVYLLGEVIGALVFGRITDHIGRKKMFMVCLGLYLCFSGLGAFSFNLWSLLVCRFVAGLGIGGEYTAINSAIDELIPSHYRGRVDIAVNGTYWLGAMIGAAASILLLNPQLLPVNVGWRLAFFIGPLLGLGVIFLRRTIPESPRWLHDARAPDGSGADRRRDRATGRAPGRPPRAGARGQGDRAHRPGRRLLHADRQDDAARVSGSHRSSASR